MKNFIAAVLIYSALIGGLGTVLLPAIRVYSPALGEMSWSVSELLKSMPRGLAPRKREPVFKVEFDFIEFLKKIMPRDPETGKPQRLSLPYILGFLVPVALAFAYLLTFLALLAAPAANRMAGFFSGLGIFMSGYALAGTYYLGLRAQAVFQETVQKAGDGFFGIIARNFVQELAIEPAAALYGLFLALVIAFMGHVYRSRK